MIYFIIYSSSIILWGFSLIDIKYPSIYSFKPYFVDCLLVFIIFIISAFIYPETFPRLWLQIFSGPYPNRTYVFASPAGFWKVLVGVPVFAISPVAINTFIGFKADPQVIQVWSFIGKFFPKGHKGPLVYFLTNI